MANDRVGDRLSDQLVGRLLASLGNASSESIAQLLSVAERLAPAGLTRDEVRAVRRLWEQDAPAAQLIRRALLQMNPHARTRFAIDFLLNNAWGKGIKLRKAFARDHGFEPPFALLISPSMRCNLRCQGCYAGEYAPEDDLPAETMDRILNEAKQIGIHFATILGGEPFIRKDLWAVYAQHNDVYFQIYTNGTTLTPETVQHIAELGNIAVAVSLEGWEAETDARRGRGVYQAIMAAFARLREAGVPFGFSAMPTRVNIDTLCSDAFNSMLVEQGCLFGWHFLYMPVGREPDMSLMPTPEQRDYLRTHGASHIRSHYPLFVIDFWNDAPYVGGCIAGKSYLHINSHGDVEPCIFTHFATDNINDKSLVECLESPFFRAIRARQPYDPNLLRPCMLIDHPHVFREIYAEQHPQPTHTGAERMVSDLADELDSYAQRAGALLDVAWESGPNGHPAPQVAEATEHETALPVHGE